VNAVVQPAKQAAIPNLVPNGQVGKANAIVAATTMLSGSIGFAIAAAVLSKFPTALNALFVGDAMTFVVGALIVLGIPNLGGGAPSISLSGALRRSWAIVGARSQLAIGTLAALLIPMGLPAVLTLAYEVQNNGVHNGPQTYSTLELVVSVGIFIGSLVVSRFASIGSMRTVGVGLLLTGSFSVAIAATHDLALIIAALFIASIGNPVYSVANQTALVEAAAPQSRGSLMATRFGLTQTAGIIGLAAGGFITNAWGPNMAFAVLGIGLVILSLFALAAGRSTVNPLHGAKYEEAVLQQAKT
jgi:predicted MFS family arabinose efflux permease